MKRGPTVPPAVRGGFRRVPTGPRRARGDAGRSRMGPYMSHAPIRISRAIRRALSGPIVPKQGSDGNPSEPDMTRQAPTSPDRSLDCSVFIRDPDVPSWDPMGPNLTPQTPTPEGV